MTLPILVGLDGKERMSKSKGNHIGVSDTRSEQYGKAMSIPDEVVMDFFVLATNVPRPELAAHRGRARREPDDHEEVPRAHHRRGVLGRSTPPPRPRPTFERTVQRKEVPDDIPEVAITEGELLIDVIVRAGAAPSKREARRLFEQGAVSVDGEPAGLDAMATAGTVVQVGKRRWLRLT